jgi:hypothetical protein
LAERCLPQVLPDLNEVFDRSRRFIDANQGFDLSSSEQEFNPSFFRTETGFPPERSDRVIERLEVRFFHRNPGRSHVHSHIMFMWYEHINYMNNIQQKSSLFITVQNVTMFM